jgi:hypothetical protein
MKFKFGKFEIEIEGLDMIIITMLICGTVLAVVTILAK